MNILGIDPSSKTVALAWLSDELGLITQKHEVKRTTRWREAQALAGMFTNLSPRYWTAQTIYIEEPVVAGPRNLRSTILIAETVGMLLGVTRSPCVLVPVTSWKKGTTGHGNSTKDEVADWLKEVHPSYSAQCDGDQDLIDATCIALYGRDVSGAVVNV